MLIPAQRTALDGKVWWCVYDTDKNRYSTYTCFGKYKSKRRCKSTIDFYTKE